jgi:hypothetical protein
VGVGGGAHQVSASCERHGRYLERLGQLIPLDFMGGCYRNRDENAHPAMSLKDRDSVWWGADGAVATHTAGRGPRKIVLASEYAFFLTVENTILDDYVTEKLYEGFLADSLMVYLGAPNAADFAPANHSFVNAADFAGPEELAAFLIALHADPPRYHSYFWWRRTVPAEVPQTARSPRPAPRSPPRSLIRRGQCGGARTEV